MTTRTRRTEITYIKHRRNNKNVGCPFCRFEVNDNQVVHEGKEFWIVKNIFPYDLWENLEVLDHLMIVPKRHVDSLHHFTPTELEEYTMTLAKYDKQGYSTYGRTSKNVAKTIAHQHTHLLKLGDRPAKALFFLRKPYILWRW